MIENKTSLLVKSQLPEFVRDNPDYQNFSLFLQAYYEWMEQTGGVTDRSKNLLSYRDVDKTTDEFIDYFVNDFLPYFPRESLISKDDAVKVARELYQSKGTPSSYQFLFRVLFNSDFEVFATKDVVLKASSGTWYISKSLKLSSEDLNFLNTKELRVFGEKSKSIATIESGVLAGKKVELFISNVERLFESGEIARIVDNSNQDVYVYQNKFIFQYNSKVKYGINERVVYNGKFYISTEDSTIGNLPTDDRYWQVADVPAYLLRSKIVGQISQIKINPVNRGLLYHPGDPVIVYNGLSSPTGIGASAVVGETTRGAIQRINVVNGGFGYTAKPNTIININSGGGAAANVATLSEYLPPKIQIVNGGHGYNVNDPVSYQNAAFAYVTTVDSNGSITSVDYAVSVNAQAIVGVTANVSSSNTSAANAIIKISSTLGSAIANIALLPIDVIGFKQNIQIGNSSYYFANSSGANANTTLSEAFSFTNLSTYPIASVVVDNGGGGIETVPEISAISTFRTEDSFGDFSVNSDLAPLGILGPLQIIDGGHGYEANDQIIITGGTGNGAYANVISVDTNGSIKSVSYVYNPTENPPKYPLGGLGYNNRYLPAATVVSANTQAANAYLTVPGILGTGAIFTTVVDRVGSVTSVKVLNYGEDYTETPNVSLKVQDIVVSNVSILDLPQKGDVVFQGPTLNLASYTATVNSISLLQPSANSSEALFSLRVFNYSSQPNPSYPLIIDTKNINLNMANSLFPQFQQTYTYFDSVGNKTVYTRDYNKYGIINYGDGNAKANATFLNGLVIGAGEYLTTQGQPSSFDVLQSTVYNNFTYQITVEKEIAKYRDVLLSLLHPTGTNVIGRMSSRSDSQFNFHEQGAMFSGRPLYYYTGVGSTVTMESDFTNKSNNIIKFNNIGVANIEDFISVGNTSISIQPTNGPDVEGLIIDLNANNNTITIDSNVWLTYANVASITGNSGSNVINITALTGAYDILNNGNYSDMDYPLKDIVYVGDKVLVGNNTSKTVREVDYENGLIYLTTNLSTNSNSLMSVKRTFIANSQINYNQIKLYGAVGQQYILPYLTTEDGLIITTEDGKILLIG